MFVVLGCVSVRGVGFCFRRFRCLLFFFGVFGFFGFFLPLRRFFSWVFSVASGLAACPCDFFWLISAFTVFFGAFGVFGVGGLFRRLRLFRCFRRLRLFRCFRRPFSAFSVLAASFGVFGLCGVFGVEGFAVEKGNLELDYGM